MALWLCPHAHVGPQALTMSATSTPYDESSPPGQVCLLVFGQPYTVCAFLPLDTTAPTPTSGVAAGPPSAGHGFPRLAILEVWRCSTPIVVT